MNDHAGGPGLRVLAVDDERPALADLARLLEASPLVSEVRAAANGHDALVALSNEHFDAMLLDVRMPGLDGVELARVISQFATPPAVVFVTAYETAAVEAFALRAVDYLMKPVGRARLAEALERVVEARAVVPGEAAGSAVEASRAAAEIDVVPVDHVRGGGTRLLPRSSILYLQAYGDYMRIYSEEGRFLLRGRLSDVERRWAPFGFARVHRGYVANLRRATEVRSQPNGTAVIVFADGSAVPIARRQVPELRRRLGA